jgi:hypothetical protein
MDCPVIEPGACAVRDRGLQLLTIHEFRGTKHLKIQCLPYSKHSRLAKQNPTDLRCIEEKIAVYSANHIRLRQANNICWKNAEFWALSQNCGKLLLPSSYLSVHPRGSHWMDFREI